MIHFQSQKICFSKLRTSARILKQWHKIVIITTKSIDANIVTQIMHASNSATVYLWNKLKNIQKNKCRVSVNGNSIRAANYLSPHKTVPAKNVQK